MSSREKFPLLASSSYYDDICLHLNISNFKVVHQLNYSTLPLYSATHLSPLQGQHLVTDHCWLRHPYIHLTPNLMKSHLLLPALDTLSDRRPNVSLVLPQSLPRLSLADRP